MAENQQAASLASQTAAYRKAVEVPPVEDAVRELLRRAYRHQAGVGRLTTEEFDLLADIADWWDKQPTWLTQTDHTQQAVTVEHRGHGVAAFLAHYANQEEADRVLATCVNAGRTECGPGCPYCGVPMTRGAYEWLCMVIECPAPKVASTKQPKTSE